MWAEEFAHVADEEVGCLESREVAAAIELRPVHDVVALLRVAPNRDALGEAGDAGGNA
jgi:hypothetical protein